MNKLLKLAKPFALAALLVFGESAWAVAANGGVGNINELPADIVRQGDSVEFFVGSEQSPIVVVADPNGPVWTKTITPLLFTPGNNYSLHEYLEVGPGLPWTDWHEHIVSEAVNWTDFSITIDGNPNDPRVSGGIDPNDEQGIWIDFTTPLAPGTLVEIWKGFDVNIYQLPGGGFDFSRQPVFEQYPTTIPLPAGLLLFGPALGLLRLVSGRRRAGRNDV